MKKFKDEFKEFAFKGNVIDMAVGVVIGGAFGKIVTSIVNDLIMPVIGFVTSGVNFSDLKYVISPAVMEGDTVVTPENAIMYGAFIQNVIDFFIIALSIFVVIKLISKAKRKQEEAPAPEPEPEAPPQDIQLLTEIRDLLKKEQ
ncbi:MAG: large-conductance mechanosensitive channel protein MscL [Firmicutes bacterium]|nr:large-conductance mechanosensitive channel protein MscL [Bacillota bacterium]